MIDLIPSIRERRKKRVKIKTKGEIKDYRYDSQKRLIVSLF